MQFALPELLYALFALLIPILVHLFQLRRFKIQKFTNLAFLEKISVQTRQSSTLKKWLILLFRMLALACIVLAFAQPYTSNTNAKNEQPELVIYLDNSFSMEASGPKGPMLKQAIQALLTEQIPLEKITVFTNTKTYLNRSLKDLKRELTAVEYSKNQLGLEAVIAKGALLFTKNESDQKYFILISDFQGQQEQMDLIENSNYQLFVIPTRPISNSNSFIEDVQIASQINNYELKVIGKTANEEQDSIQLSLFNGQKLIGKSILEKSKGFKTSFTVPKNESFTGKFILEDSGLTFDNNFYFNIEKAPKTSVLSIGDHKTDYLNRIFTKAEFKYNYSTLQYVDYKILQQQDLVVISELKQLPNALINNLKSFMKGGGSVLFIPAVNGDMNSYNSFLDIENIKFNSLSSNEKKITAINFDHPIFKEAFERKVKNFQYPRVNQHYKIDNQAKTLLTFEDGKPFLLQKKQLFFFTAAIGSENSNFTNSPLIVPTIFGIGKSSYKLPKLYYNLSQKSELDLKYSLKNEEVVKITRENKTFIPYQNKQNSKLKIILEDLPIKAGHYALHEKSDTLQYLSFNYDRNESELEYPKIQNFSSYEVFNSIKSSLESLKSGVNVNELWKWFVIFALIFLALEMLILKISE
ncbi:MAG TPA: hypothetical protein DHV91_00560 [Flavobacteriaceae bacterium]|nr:hypothetical protein [Flavobacteriaceae bacterium]